ncbi:MAG: hypothetical protein WDN30_13810 [Pararobbsia sp.]
MLSLPAYRPHFFHARDNMLALARREADPTTFVQGSFRMFSEDEILAQGEPPTLSSVHNISTPEGVMDGEAHCGAGESFLDVVLAKAAIDAASPEALVVNRLRLDRADAHYRSVAAGRAELDDPEFTTGTMRSLTTWLRALTVLDERTYPGAGRCAQLLLSMEVTPDFQGHFTVQQFGTTDLLASDLDALGVSHRFIDIVMPLLYSMHLVIANKGDGAQLLEEQIEVAMLRPGSLAPRPSDDEQASGVGSSSSLQFDGIRLLPDFEAQWRDEGHRFLAQARRSKSETALVVPPRRSK